MSAHLFRSPWVYSRLHTCHPNEVEKNELDNFITMSGAFAIVRIEQNGFMGDR